MARVVDISLPTGAQHPAAAAEAKRWGIELQKDNDRAAAQQSAHHVKK
jgi:hypothetical protein